MGDLADTIYIDEVGVKLADRTRSMFHLNEVNDAEWNQQKCDERGPANQVDFA